ncbi:MAG: acyloxyacyl hydrolase, partial [bacterium]|nr:acyloxyacyl hydrolase [bacterium]
ASNAGCGLQYFFNKRDAVTLEWRFIHLSNAGIDCKNSGLNMNNILIGFTRLF